MPGTTAVICKLPVDFHSSLAVGGQDMAGGLQGCSAAETNGLVLRNGGRAPSLALPM